MTKNNANTTTNCSENSHDFLTSETSTSPIQSNLPFIVVINALEEELDALKIFLMQLTPNKKIAYILMLQPSSNNIHCLSELLQPYTSMSVVPISKQQTIKANYVHILPPDKKITIHNNVLQIINTKPGKNEKSPTDLFLCSLAENQGRKAIYIILSGIENGEKIGLQALRKEGSLVIAQTSKSDQFNSELKNVINTGVIDYILSPEETYAFLLKYIAHLNDKTIQIAHSLTEDFQYILVLLKNQTGHDFSLYKINTIYRRIQKRLDLLCIDTLSAYVYYMHQHPAEITILFKEILINVTNFFRDPEAFDLFNSEILYRMRTSWCADKSIRVWIAGCSTGEEAFSIAIMLQESMSAINHPFNVQIFATDIDEDAIEIARAGIFPLSIEKYVSPDKLEKYFTKEADHYKIKIFVRKTITFAIQNIINDPPFIKLHILSCRNLLIYFKSQLQQKILRLFHNNLIPHGLLFLGSTENVGPAGDYYTTIDQRHKIYEQKNDDAIINYKIDLSSNDLFSAFTDGQIMQKNTNNIEPNLSVLVKGMLLKKYAPACVVIDDTGNIVFVFGHTSKFLEFAPGEARFQFMDMVRSDLRSKIHIAIRSASNKQKEITLNNLQIKEEDAFKCVNIKIIPLTDENFTKRKLLLIIFEECITHQPTKITSGKHSIDKKIAQLEQELQYTKNRLQTTIEELETSNEELKSTNEELQSSNKELQSTNEEIDTSKEELHSLNEEITTINHELENRIQQLSCANEDIRHLLDHTDIATVFIDKNLCIKRFTPKATEIINLILSDVGRPINHIVSKLCYKGLVDDARTVLKTLEPLSTECIDTSGHWHIIRMIPYRTTNKRIDGVVITFLSIQEKKQAENKITLLEKKLLETKEFNNKLLSTTISKSAVLLDRNANVILANQQFLKEFEITSEEIQGHSFYNIKSEWCIKSLKNLIEQTFQDESSDYPVKIEVSPGDLVTFVAHRLSTSTLLLIIN